MGGWVQIDSWHLQSGLISRSGMIHTLCGRWAAVNAESAANLPMGEKSCETCLRLKIMGDGDSESGLIGADSSSSSPTDE